MDRQEDLGGRQTVTDAFDLLPGDLPATPPPSTHVSSSESRRAEIVVALTAQQSPDPAGDKSNSSSSDADSTNSAPEMFSGIPSSEIISQLLAAKAAVAKLEAELAAAQQTPVKSTPEHKTDFSMRKEDTPAHDGGVQDDNVDSGDDDACSGVHQSAFQSAASSLSLTVNYRICT